MEKREEALREGRRHERKEGRPINKDPRFRNGRFEDTEEERGRRYREPRKHHRDDRPRRYDGERRPHHGGKMIVKTKLFSSKEELVKYVNEIGELGHRVEIFKIDEGLYKVEVLEHNNPRVKTMNEKTEL